MRSRLKNILRLITSKTFLGSIAFAIALWLYTNLNQEYLTFVEVPLRVLLPPNRALESSLPEKISVEVKGNGWQLFNLNIFRTSAICEINLTESSMDSTYLLTRNDFIKNLQLLNVQAIDVAIQNLELKTGQITDFSVPVKPIIKIITRPGFAVVGNIEVKPDLINIRGNSKITGKLEEWKTKSIVIDDVFMPVSMFVHLSDSLFSVVTPSVSIVKINADIQKIAEVKIPDVKIRINGSQLNSEHIISPEIVTVTIRGGIHIISNIDYEQIIAKINTFDIMNDSAGILVPEIQLPEHIRLVRIDPPFVNHKIIIPTKENKIAGK